MEESFDRIVLWFGGLPVSVNRAFRAGKGKYFRSKEYDLYIERTRFEMMRFGWPRAPWPRVHVTVWLFPPNRQKYDADNRTKTLLDALTHSGFWEDDSVVKRLDVLRGEVPDPGGATIVAAECADADEMFGMPASLKEMILRKREETKKRKKR